MNQPDKEDQKSNISFQQVSWGLLAVVAVLFVVLNSDKSENEPHFRQTRIATFRLSADVDAHWLFVGKAHRAS